MSYDTTSRNYLKESNSKTQSVEWWFPGLEEVYESIRNKDEDTFVPICPTNPSIQFGIGFFRSITNNKSHTSFLPPEKNVPKLIFSVSSHQMKTHI